jgi:serine/threonine protein kinase
VLCHIADQLVKLHAAGIAHRDLKPENIIWLPSRNEWTLIDFGCAARIGCPASLSYSLKCVAIVLLDCLVVHSIPPPAVALRSLHAIFEQAVPIHLTSNAALRQVRRT